MTLWRFASGGPDRNAEPEAFRIRIVTPAGERQALDFHPPVHHLRLVSRLLIALAILQILDMASTLLLLSIGGTEMNPVARWALDAGVGWFVALKLSVATILLLFVPLFERPKLPDGARTATWSCLGVDVVFAAVVVSNLAQVVLFA